MTFEDLHIKTKPNAGVRYSTVCPACSSDRKPENRNKECLTVNNETGNRWYKCNHPGCTFHGNIDLKEKYNKVYQESKMPKIQKRIFSAPVNEWFSLRQIDPIVAVEKGRCYEVKKSLNRFELGFPFYYKGQLVNAKFRRLQVQEGMSKVYQVKREHGTLQCFLGLHNLNFTEEHPDVLIIEGEVDWLTWLQCEIGTIGNNVLSVPDGAPAPEQVNLDKRIDFLKDKYVLELLKKARRIYIAMDDDKAGNNFKSIIAEHVGKMKCWLVPYPPRYKDSNEVYAGDAKKGLDPLGKPGIQEMYDGARAFPMRGVIRASELEAEIDDISKRGFQKGYIIGEDKIDEYLSLKRDLTVIVTGIPNHGKSTWLRWYLVKQCIANPFMRFGVYSPESRPKREYAKIGEVYSGKSYFQYASNAMNEAERHKAKAWTNEHFIIVNPDRNVFELFDPQKRIKGLKNILGYFRQLKENDGIFGYVIDPWNKLEHERPGGMTETDFISRQLDIVTEFNEIHDMCGFVIAHPTKIETVRGGNFRPPTLYDISGSANWFNKPNIGISVYRRDFYNTKQKNEDGDDIWEQDESSASQIHVSKMKEEELGKKGRIEMWMDKRAGNRFVFERPAKILSEQKKIDKADPFSYTKDDLPF